MDRTIKFRGKSIYDEKWQYGSLVKIEKDRYAVIPSLNDIEIGKSIGMYVNGKYPKIVKYIDEYACFCLANISDLNKKWMYPWQQVSPGWWIDHKQEIRVVANIYDHPELIKEE